MAVDDRFEVFVKDYKTGMIKAVVSLPEEWYDGNLDANKKMTLDDVRDWLDKLIEASE